MRRGAAILAILASPLALAAPVSPAAAQAPVQAVPAADGQRLNAALARLGRDPRDLDALIEAGVAALSLGDVEAAIGFLRRADQISPNNPRVKAGLAGAMVRNENPFEAIALFAEAERAGSIDIALAPDWGLAYDLVGDNAAAQRYYQAALASASGVNDEARRRLALSQAIAGDKKAFEATLLPLIQRQDKAAWRVRTFALAILGEPEEAVSIANATMPREMASAIAPYLRYMPRLTPAQQAAAANLGHFPRASEIGRDDPRIAAYAPATPRRGARSADAGLIPKGAPLGRSSRTREQAARQTSRARRGATATGASPPATVAAAPPRTAPPEPQPQRTATPPPPAVTASASPAAPPATATVPPPASSAATPSAPAAAAVALDTVIAAQARPVVEPPAAAAVTLAAAPAQAALESPAAPVQGPEIGAPPSATAPAPVPAPSPAAPHDIAAAFSDLALPVADVGPAPGAVDVRKIEPPRPEAARPPEPKPAAKPAAKPKPPAHPSRIWVQVATGRDKKALSFDWRKLSREAAEALKNRKPFVSAWGQTNRLLTGPFESEKAANAFMALLRKEKMAPFIWTSPAGQVVDALPVR